MVEVIAQDILRLEKEAGLMIMTATIRAIVAERQVAELLSKIAELEANVSKDVSSIGQVDEIGQI